jgi:hypothetical protein
MNIVNLYKTLKQILDDSNMALITKGFNQVNSLHHIVSELKTKEVNNLPYLLNKQITEVTLEDLNSVTNIGS